MSNELEVLEVREFEIREVDEEERTVSGLAVPYNQTISVNGYQERVEKGAFAEVAEGVQLFYGHDHRTGGLPIGKVVEARESDEGLIIKAKFSDTNKANEVRTLVRDGVLHKFSVGFQPVKTRKDNGVMVREKGNLKEVSIVAIPAYANASVSEVRDDSNNTKENEEIMNDELTPAIEELREQFGEVRRELALVGQAKTEEKVVSQYRSAGEWIKANASGDTVAKAEAELVTRAYTGATFADNDDATRPQWLNANLKLVEAKRPFTNLFRSAPIPTEGMAFTYPQVTGTVGTVGKQLLEGDDLPYMEVSVGTASGTIDTYGGYSSLSKQVIDQSGVAFLDLTIRNLFNQYANATEKAVVDAFVGATPQTHVMAAGTARDYVRAALQGRRLIKTNAQGAVGEVVVVGYDVFETMVTLVDSAGRPLFDVNGDGANTWGSANVSAVAGSLAGLPVMVSDTLAESAFYVLSTEALTVRSSGIQSLQDQNIINLTKDFSVAGYLGVEINNPLAIVKVDATAALV